MNAHAKATYSSEAVTAKEANALQEALPDIASSAAATDLAMQNTLLTPRFYTTDFDKMDAIDVTPVRKDWDALIARMQSDPNKGHFKKNADWEAVDWAGMEPGLCKESIDFLVSSCTAEFSGCVLYKEMKRRGSNKDETNLFQLMARDEARHAGFINDALRETTGYALLTALALLALIEHWLMVVPLPDAKLWRWMLPAPKPMTTKERQTHGL